MGKIAVVRDDKKGGAEFLAAFHKRLHDETGIGFIETCRRLVGENDLGFSHQHSGQSRALHLASGKVSGRCVGTNAETIQKISCTLPC